MPTRQRKAKGTALHPSLGDFEGRPIEGIKVIVTKAGDGLSDAMAVGPKVLHQGDEGVLVLRFKTTKIRFDPRKPGKEEEADDCGVYRVQILEAGSATFIDEDLVGDALEEQEKRLAVYRDEQRRLADEKKGIFRLPTGESGDDAAADA